MNKVHPSIITQRCALRLPESEEANLMCDFVIENKNHLLPYEPSHPQDYYQIDFWQKKIHQLRDDFVNDKSCCLNIYLRENNQLIGTINYSHFIRGGFQSCFLGFKIAEKIQNQGLMTEALKASIIYVFRTLNLHRIAANYMPCNITSEKVLKKCGFKKEGMAENYLCINGRWEDHVLTSLINNQWDGPTS